MTPDEWDRRIAPRLGLIENVTHWLKYDAANLQSAITGLEVRPVWETLAREGLQEAEIALRSALAQVMAAQDIYDNLPHLLNDRDDEQLRYETETGVEHANS